MNKHLSKEQFASYALGERHPQVQHHLSDCEACRGEVRRFQSAVGDLRAFMCQIGDQEYRQPALPARWLLMRSRWSPVSLARFAAVVFGFVLIFFSAGGRFHLKPTPPDAPKIQVASTSDAQLWSEVEDETSRTAAPAMDPLLGTAEQSGPATYLEAPRR